MQNLDDQNEGGSTLIIHNNHKRLCGAPFYPPKDPMLVSHSCISASRLNNYITVVQGAWGRPGIHVHGGVNWDVRKLKFLDPKRQSNPGCKSTGTL